MRFFSLHPDDARWLRVWLRNNLIGTFAILCVLLGVRFLTFAPPAYQTEASARQQTELRIAADGNEGRSFAPNGWRRTKHGWEHISSWKVPTQSLGQIIEHQQSREPRWVQSALESLRRIPPVVFAMVQLTMIAFIVWIASVVRPDSA